MPTPSTRTATYPPFFSLKPSPILSHSGRSAILANQPRRFIAGKASTAPECTTSAPAKLRSCSAYTRWIVARLLARTCSTLILYFFWKSWLIFSVCSVPIEEYHRIFPSCCAACSSSASVAADEIMMFFGYVHRQME